MLARIRNKSIESYAIKSKTNQVSIVTYKRMGDLRIIIMTIDVSRTDTRSRDIVTMRPSVVADHRHNNTSIMGLIHDILEIARVVLQATASIAVFVLGLVENHRTSIGNLGFGDGPINVLNITIKQ